MRSRFEHLLKDPFSPQKPHLTGLDLGDLLEGREWQEAMLILNSFDNVSLRKICANTRTNADEDSSEQTSGGHENMDHSAHGGH